MNCGNCGSNVNPGDMFCQKCGAGINNSKNSQNTVINDEVLVDAYIGKNIEELRKGNFSWCTFFFDVYYAFYRKMWLFSLLYFLSYLVVFALLMVLILILIKQTNEITFIQNYVKYYLIIYGGISLTSLALRLVFSFKFKKAYLKQATKKVEQIKIRNMGKTNEEIKKECSKKGGTSIFGIFLSLLLPVVLIVLISIPYAIQNKNTLDKVQKGAAKDSAYSIIKSVELAHLDALLIFMDKKESITLEDVRNEYWGMSSTWDGNTITSKGYDFTCDVTVNNDNKMLVSCDVFGEKIESDLFDLNIGNKENNQANNNEENDKPNDETNNIQDNNDDTLLDNNNEKKAWEKYLLSTNISHISVGGFEGTREITYSLTISELKEILGKLNSYNLKKSYVKGLGGHDSTPFHITYNIGGNNHSFHISNGSLISTQDKDMIKALDKSVSIIENEQYKNQKGYAEVYYFEPNLTSLFNEYYELKRTTSEAKAILKAAQLYYVEKLLDVLYIEEEKIFTFDGKTNPEELELVGNIHILGNITLTEKGDVHIGLYNENTKKYEGDLIVNGYTCKQINYESSLKYDVICKK